MSVHPPHSRFTSTPLTHLRICLLWTLLLCTLCAQKPVYSPKIAPADDAGKKLIPSVKVPKEFRVGLFAEHPLVANAVTFAVGNDGRVFVGESYRQETKGVPDNRSFSYWRDDDLKSLTVADRLAMYLSHRPELAMQFTAEHDRIVVVEDKDGDGAADASHVYADGFNDILDGTGAGLLVRGKDVWFTCIPHLWKLTDRKGSGVADRRQILSTGYGVRVALRGHDSHGLVIGTDGRLYFSIGDRGFDIHTKEGRHLSLPYSGAVFRCELDGSDLQLFATGLRNPQELAFDDYGNLFTCDNNSDSKDKARVVYVVEGGETGWRMNFQYRSDRGGWVSEGWWQTRFEGQASFLIPPLMHLGSGPSGLVAYPGTGLPEAYDNRFFFCDFLGGRNYSGVRSFSFEPQGAGFKVAQHDKFAWGILATDVDFMPDGRMLISDWVQGWVGVGKGRLWSLQHEDLAVQSKGQQTAALLNRDWGKVSVEECLAHLGHADRRVRMEAQLRLATEGQAAVALVADLVLNEEAPRMARLHGLWTLAQRTRQQGLSPMTLDPRLLTLVDHEDDEVRAQAIRTFDDLQHPRLAELLLPRLNDDSARVRYFAALAAGRVGDEALLAPVVELLRENADSDVFLRHAGVMGLTRLAEQHGLRASIAALKGDSSRSVRLAAVLALRRLNAIEVSAFLDDGDLGVAEAAARAIYDVPLKAQYRELALRLKSNTARRSAPFARRAVAAIELMGDPEYLPDLVAFAAAKLEGEALEKVQEESLMVLRDWATDRSFDRLLNMHRERSAGDAKAAASVLKMAVSLLIENGPERVRNAAILCAERHRLSMAQDSLLSVVRSAKGDHGKQQSGLRVNALKALYATDASDLDLAVQIALKDSDAKVRSEAAGILARIDPDDAMTVIQQSLKEASTAECQIAFRTLAKLKRGDADDLLAAWMQRLHQDEVPVGARLELLDAAARRAKAGVQSLSAQLKRYDEAVIAEGAMAQYEPCLEGGDAGQGRRIFMNKAEVSCRRCHALGKSKPTDATAMAGPDLSKIGALRDRSYLLRSVVHPNADIAEGFESWFIETKQEDSYRGRIISESKEKLVMEYYEANEPAQRVTLNPEDISYRKRENTSMPEDLVKKLSRRELRNLIEFLATRK